MISVSKIILGLGNFGNGVNFSFLGFFYIPQSVMWAYLTCPVTYAENQFSAVYMMLRNNSVYSVTCGFNIYFLILVCLKFTFAHTLIEVKKYKEDISMLPLHPNKKHFPYPGSSLYLVDNYWCFE